MSPAPYRTRQAAAALTGVLLVTACAARYRTVRDDGPAGATVTTAGPTAGVQVTVGGVAVTTVQTGTSFLIQPTPDTAEAGQQVAASCPNPGIVRADYTLANGQPSGEQILSAVRQSGACTDLSVGDQIATAGTYNVTLVVTGGDGQTARASMTLVVTSGTPSGSPGFAVSATPTSCHPGDQVTFSGPCDGGSVSWDFADGNQGSGTPAQHAFAAVGQFEVKATCERPGSGSESGSVTIDVTPAGATTAGAPGATTGTPAGGTAGSGDTSGATDGNGTASGGTTGGTGGTTGATGGTTGDPSGATGGTGNATGGTTGATGGSTAGNTAGNTTGSAGGSTAGNTTGSAGGSTAGNTTGSTAGNTTGSTTGNTTGGGTGSTAGSTSGSTTGPDQNPVQASGPTKG